MSPSENPRRPNDIEKIVQNGQHEDIQELRHEQIKNLVDTYSLHKEVGQMKWRYYRSFPPLPQRTSEYNNCFDIPLLIDQRVELPRLIKIAGIKELIIPEKIVDQTVFACNTISEWTHDGSRYPEASPKARQRQYFEDEAGSTLREIVFQYMQYPEHFRGFVISGSASLWRGRNPRLEVFEKSARLVAGGISENLRVISRAKDICKK